MNPKPSPKLCLVEDDEIMGESLVDRFRLEGFDIEWHRRAADAHRAIGRQGYHAVISDIRLPDFAGDILFARLHESAIEPPPFLFITGHGSIERAVSLLKAGAADYVTKPFDLDDLVLKVRQLCRNHAPAPPAPVSHPLGLSPAMQRVEATLRRLATHASTLLITGESGVGKEHVAQLLHDMACAGRERPFVAVNCGAITESLIEAELFGHERGAFTGAARQRKGVFEQAHGGTLFLDEIGDMPFAMQVKLLRAMQDRRIVRVGGETAVPVDLRIICATNQDLRARVEAGTFREDLYYRINVVHVRIPLLRDRPEDILWFARRFLREFSELHGGEPRTLSPAAEHALLAYPWPGNLRELRHCIERACVLCGAAELQPPDLFEDWRDDRLPDARAVGTLDQYIRECERRYIEGTLAHCSGHIMQAAAHLGISRKNLWEKMKRLGIEAAR
ncbi:sigma-54-dependent transcriptional regulator [Ramlibacter montanisoli]|uniref:Sigma-54-dependent Fis family transcriptional regulator n=1 Tax=Ramlibacter montanisoli TaxID=2732512 RepID=A0A849K2R7_9BURK|nr:sigma-54 dependent transcriptional regulator [Ramlibacter montanisoli]NNU42778.1 sigma-54-dependent Fis family transcriptional regulator [Ramlibacter montanisoli]